MFYLITNKMTKYIISFLEFIVKIIMRILNRLNSKNFSLSKPIYQKSGRFLTYFALNPTLLPHKDILKLIHNGLQNDEDFIKFGSKKVMILKAIINNQIYSFHHNVLITNTSTFEEYYNQIKRYINNLYNSGTSYEGGIDSIPMFEITIWDISIKANVNIKPTTHTNSRIVNILGGLSSVNRLGKNQTTKTTARSYSTRSGFSKSLTAFNLLGLGLLGLSGFNKPSIRVAQITLIKHFGNISGSKVKIDTSKFITPIDLSEKDKKDKFWRSKALSSKQLAALDIETITLDNFDNTQIPVVITFSSSNFDKIFTINHRELKDAISSNSINKIDKIVCGLWDNLFKFLLNLDRKHIIFVHNLGGFDGIFIYKYMLKLLVKQNIECLIDAKNKFISIDYKVKNGFSFRDSYRVFPVKLDDLTKIFGFMPKHSKYNTDFNRITVFENKMLLNEFKKYSIQDAKSLYLALFQARNQYMNSYDVDICDVYSTSTLSLWIFRFKFLKHLIPIMERNEDTFIRKAYFGGATDYYKAYGKNLKYYDVNSLYPFAMKKPMPLNLIKKHNKVDSLNNFFGFIECSVEAPDSIKIPILPVKAYGKTIFPIGKWKAVYFSEEIKEALKLGYKITLGRGYEYSKADLFGDYIDHFYDKKKNSTGADRFIAKMHLNQLYGYFGRKLDLIRTINIDKDKLPIYLKTHIIKSIIELEDSYTLMVNDNLNYDLVSILNESVELDLKSKFSLVKSNVGLAAAVTSYARIHMIPFKISGKCYYTDTDSVFIEGELPIEFIGKELGLMKDELDGLSINEAYFLGIKQYGYTFTKDGKLIDKSVFAGVPRDSICFSDIVKLFKGDSLNIKFDARFYKSLINLSVKIKPVEISLKLECDKKLYDNNYLPLVYIDSNLNKDLSWIVYHMKSIISKFKYYIRKLTVTPLDYLG